MRRVHADQSRIQIEPPCNSRLSKCRFAVVSLLAITFAVHRAPQAIAQPADRTKSADTTPNRSATERADKLSLRQTQFATPVTAKTEATKLRTTRRAFRIPFHITDEEARDFIAEVQLYYSYQGGQWQQYAAATPHLSPTLSNFTFRTDRDGEYWFAVRTCDKHGNLTPADVEELEPGLKVLVGESKSVEEIIEEKVQTWEQAIFARDHSAIDRLVAGDLKYITATGDFVTVTRREAVEPPPVDADAIVRCSITLAGWPASLIMALLQQSQLKIKHLETDEIRVRLYGRVAIATGRTAFQYRENEQAGVRRYRFTSVFTPDGPEDWKMVSYQQTFVANDED